MAQDDYDSAFVTPRELGVKLDEVYEVIDGNGGIRERLTRVESYLKAMLILVPVAGIFGPDIAAALT
jgi:hypothetical protein